MYTLLIVKCDYLMTLESEIHQTVNRDTHVRKRVKGIYALKCLRNDVQYFEGTRNEY